MSSAVLLRAFQRVCLCQCLKAQHAAERLVSDTQGGRQHQEGSGCSQRRRQGGGAAPGPGLAQVGYPVLPGSLQCSDLASE
jgi:hypothetical protein